MAAKQAQVVTIPVTINVSEAVYGYITKNAGEPITPKLQSWLNFYLSQMASGGLMLESVDHDHLAELRDGKRFRTSAQLAREVEKALKREEGQYSYTLQIDPAYVKSVEDRATEQGVSTQQFVADLFAYIMGSGFVYDFTPANGCMFPLEYSDMIAAREILGREVNASDYVALIREALAAREQVKKLPNAVRELEVAVA
jgi:hypothetical protein